VRNRRLYFREDGQRDLLWPLRPEVEPGRGMEPRSPFTPSGFNMRIVLVDEAGARQHARSERDRSDLTIRSDVPPSAELALGVSLPHAASQGAPSRV
jgi:hypothetical protein